eukprot:1149456-Prymnesium_polylepis.1
MAYKGHGCTAQRRRLSNDAARRPRCGRYVGQRLHTRVDSGSCGLQCVCVSARAPVRSGNPDCLPDSAGRVAGSPRTWNYPCIAV